MGAGGDRSGLSGCVPDLSGPVSSSAKDKTDDISIVDCYSE